MDVINVMFGSSPGQNRDGQQRRHLFFFTGFIVKGRAHFPPCGPGLQLGSGLRYRLTLPQLTGVYLPQQPLQQPGGAQRSHHHQHRIIRRRSGETRGRRTGTGTAAPLCRCCRHHGVDCPLMTSAGHKHRPRPLLEEAGKP